MGDVEHQRLARIKERTLWWQFRIIHTPGKLQLATDALSRRKSKLPANLYRLSAADSDAGEEDVIADVQLKLTDHTDPEHRIRFSECVRRAMHVPITSDAPTKRYKKN